MARNLAWIKRRKIAYESIRRLFDKHAARGMVLDGLDISKTPEVVRFLSSPGRFHEQRLVVNVIPTGVREHIIPCVVCSEWDKFNWHVIHTKRIKAPRQPNRWQIKIRMIYPGIEWDDDILTVTVFSKDWLGATRDERWETLRYLEQQKARELLEDHCLPYDLDGWNVGENDLVHCPLCPRSIVVRKFNAERIMTEWANLDIVQAMQRFHSTAAHFLRYGYRDGALQADYFHKESDFDESWSELDRPAAATADGDS